MHPDVGDLGLQGRGYRVWVGVRNVWEGGVWGRGMCGRVGVGVRNVGGVGGGGLHSYMRCVVWVWVCEELACGGGGGGDVWGRVVWGVEV